MSEGSTSNQFQILLLGDAKVGKTSMIETYITLSFPQKVGRINDDSIIPSPSHDEYMSCILCDSSDDPKDPVLLQKLGSSDIVFLLHDASRPATLESLRYTWLPLVKAAFGSDRTKSAVIIRNKNDLFTGVCDYRVSDSDSKTSATVADDNSDADVAVSQDGTGYFDDGKNEDCDLSHSTNDDLNFSYMGVDVTQADKFSFAELEIGRAFSFISALSICSSARRLDQVVDLFVSAEEMFRCPLAPLYTKELGYTSKCLVALQRIFRHHDQDHDGVLSDEEFKKLQYFSLGITISDDELSQMKALIESISADHLAPIWTNMFPVASSTSDGSSFTSFTGQPLHLSSNMNSDSKQLVNSSTGVTLSGFRKILEMHICRDRQGVVWDILRAHGYSVDLEIPLSPNMLQGFMFNNAGSDEEETDEDEDNEEDEDEDEDEDVSKENAADGGVKPSVGDFVQLPYHPGCVCPLPSRDFQSTSWEDLQSPITSQPHTTAAVATLLSPDAVDFLHGLFSQKRGSRQKNMAVKIAPELAFSLSVFSSPVAKAWQSIVLASDDLLPGKDQDAPKVQDVAVSNKTTIYTLYNPFPTEAAVRKWLTLWHALALSIPPHTLSALLFQLGFIPPAMLHVDPQNTLDDVTVSMSRSSHTVLESSVGDVKLKPPTCFACNCLEQHPGRALDSLQHEISTSGFDMNSSSPYSARQAIRKIGVFGREQVGKTSIIAAFSDLYSDKHSEKIREKVGTRDMVVGGFCIQAHVISPGDVNMSTSVAGGSSRKSRKTKSKISSSPSTSHTVDASTLPASCFVHYIASEVPGNASVYDDDESARSSFDLVAKQVAGQNMTSMSQLSHASSCSSGSSVEETFHVQDEASSDLNYSTVTEKGAIATPEDDMPPPPPAGELLLANNIANNVTSSITSEDIFSFHDNSSLAVSQSSSQTTEDGSLHLQTTDSSVSLASSSLTESQDLQTAPVSAPDLAATELNSSSSSGSSSVDSSFFLSTSSTSESTSSTPLEPPHKDDDGSNLSTALDIDREMDCPPISSRSSSNSCSRSSSICSDTRHWIDTNKQTCDIALLIFDAFEMETLEYLLEIDAILPSEIVRVFISTKFSRPDDVVVASTLGADEAYAKSVEYIREHGLPQVEQLFSLDESTINNLKRSIHDTYNRAIASSLVGSKTSSLLSSQILPTTPTRDRTSLSAQSPVSPMRGPAFSSENDDDEDVGNDVGVDDDERTPSKDKSRSRDMDITSFFNPFSLSKLLILVDSAVTSYFPSYRAYLPGLVLGPSVLFVLVTLYRKSTKTIWTCSPKA